MAQLDVQPKKQTPIWIWLLLLLILIAGFFIFRNYNSDKKVATSTTDSTATNVVAGTTVPNWDTIDFNAPNTTDEDITDAGILLRGKDNYVIYGLGENILFESGGSSILPIADKQLNQIASSLKKRHDDANIAVFGNTDSVGTAGDNKKLGLDRAEAVKKWLIDKAGIAAERISVRSEGQTDPVADNGTQNGRQMNRNVEIAAMNKN